jgi:hypothetical protein
MQSADQYEELAADHRTRAERIADPVLKGSLLEIAKNYEAMAERVRRVPAPGADRAQAPN